MNSQATANLTVKKPVKSAIITSALAVMVATSGTSFVVQFLPKPATIKSTPSVLDAKSTSTSSIIKRHRLSYTKPKSYAKPFFISAGNKEEEIGVVDNTEFHKVTSEIVFIPIHHEGKLPTNPENSLILSNDREKVDISHKVEEISLATRCAGRLPVGRERI